MGGDQWRATSLSLAMPHPRALTLPPFNLHTAGTTSPTFPPGPAPLRPHLQAQPQQRHPVCLLRQRDEDALLQAAA